MFKHWDLGGLYKEGITMEFCYPTPALDLTQDIDLTQDHSQFPEKLKALDEFPEWG